MKNNKHHKLIILTLLLTITVVARASDYIAEEDFFGESPVVLTVSRMHKPLADSPASVSVIDRQMIKNSGARQIADIFRLIPGFVVGYQSGHTPVVTYHGLGEQWQRQLQVLIDGRSVFIPSFGGVPWSNLPLLLQDIERVEVTRGPNAVTYGANAFLATINIITRNAAEDLGGELVYTHDLDDDHTTQDAYFRYGNNYQDLDWRITAGREKDDGYSGINDSKLLEKVNIRSDFLTAHNQFWTIQVGVNNSHLGRGDGDVTDILRDEETTNSYQNIKWELINDQVSTTVLLTHTHQDADDHFQTEALNEFLADELGLPILTTLPAFYGEINYDRVSDRMDLEIFQNRSFSPQVQLVYGASVRKDKVKSFYLFNDLEYHEVNNQRLFSSVEWKPSDSLILDLGLMLEDTNFTDQESSYRFSLIQKFDQHNLRLVSSSAKRNPVLYEEIGETQFIINLPAGLPPPFDQPYPLVTWRTTTDLDPETIESIELGLFSEFYENQLTTDVKIFSYKISDHIDEIRIDDPLDPVTGLPQQYWTAFNGGETEVDGIEFSFNYSPLHKRFRLYGGISVPESDSYKNDFYESVPDYTAYLAGHINLTPTHQISASFYTIDEIRWRDTSDDIAQYQKLDMRYQFTINPKNDINLELIGYNLLEEYEDYYEDNLQEKMFLLRISGRF